MLVPVTVMVSFTMTSGRLWIFFLCLFFFLILLLLRGNLSHQDENAANQRGKTQ